MKYLIAGLGNPGAEYANTRHNIGFLALDALARKGGTVFQPDRYAEVARLRHKGRILILIKPQTYMNLSGKAVRYWLDKEGISPENMLVVSDDLDLPQGSIRLRAKGSGGSHNGLNHIIEILDTIDFPRLRIGIGADFPKGMQVDYVLGKWTANEEKTMLSVLEQSTAGILAFVTMGINQAMNIVNKKPPALPENEQ
jgi:PTH1 family peptidyl-tRNA hydrolase